MTMVSLERIKFDTTVLAKGRGSSILSFLSLIPLRKRLVSESTDPCDTEGSGVREGPRGCE
jgi:hypothetical protein